MEFTDQTGRKIILEKFPERIISLVPSQTELLCDLGLENKIMGITKFCVHPTGLKNLKTLIGGTKNLRIDTIAELHPDIIIANKEENEKQQIEQLAEKFPVWISDVKTFADALDMIRDIAIITQTELEGKKMIEKILSEKMQYHLHHSAKNQKVLYLIWKNPYMATGSDTFIHTMLHEAGFENTTAHINRYPELQIVDIIALQPEVIFLSSEPYPFSEKHIAELQIHLPDTTIQLVDGEMFSWYGSRLLHCWQYFTSLQLEA